MKIFFSKDASGKVLLVAFALLIIFQFLILVNFIPYNVAWAGQLTKDNYVIMSLISIIIIILFMAIIAIKLQYILKGKVDIIGTIGAWIIFIYLILNTMGNIASAVSIENLVFAPITIIMAVFSLFFALSK
jgi:hypothetical protein